jgi:hypothetical protein
MIYWGRRQLRLFGNWELRVQNLRWSEQTFKWLVLWGNGMLYLFTIWCFHFPGFTFKEFSDNCGGQVKLCIVEGKPLALQDVSQSDNKIWSLNVWTVACLCISTCRLGTLNVSKCELKKFLLWALDYTCPTVYSS